MINKALSIAIETGENVQTVEDTVLHKSMCPYKFLSLLKCSSGKDEYSKAVCSFLEDIMDHMASKRKKELLTLVADNEECWPETSYTFFDELEYEYNRFMR
jgi:hypothetical protein